MNCRFLKLLLIACLFTCAQASAQANQCNDGIDNDGDGRIDGLRELAITNGVVGQIGGAGSPDAISQAVANAIRTKGLALTIPLHAAGSQILRADHPYYGRHNDEGGTLHLPTLTKVCNILGYRTYVSSTCRSDGGSGRCNYYSPGNNYMWRFANGNFALESATYKTWIASITCRDVLSACSDGLDNDGDGRVDRADPDCLSDLDNSERPKDPECLPPGSTNESVQCSNRLDDDRDGAIDFPADFSCTSPQDNDETNTKSQCQDGIDNDNDGAIDTADFSCSNTQDNDETNGKSQCQDGLDNDSDGATDFPADFSCTSAQDNDETNTKSQCQDGLDNDNDGSIDFPADFSCTTAQDNDETNGKSQCQDGLDNDNDGATDTTDFSCTSPQDNDETNTKSQCQDGLDNDSDGATDFPADFSCTSAQDNDETNTKSQCQDGLDNDSDGVTDFPADFSCTTPQDNDETNTKSQCQDGLDNDNDGATDTTDFSCTSPQDNDETNTKSQCQDGLDNDSDGAIDFPADFACSSKQDNNESDQKASCQDGFDNDSDDATDFPNDFSCTSGQDNDELNSRSQCQDGVDNDSDGAIDFPADFACSSKQDNNESDRTAACQDGSDNDTDGLVDTADPGCQSPQDNDESDEVQKLTLGTECVVDNIDGSRTAYFSYNNITAQDLNVPIGSSVTQINEFSPSPVNLGQPATFLKGMQKGVVRVNFTTPSLTWTVRPSGARKATASATSSTPQCAPLEPLLECRGFESGILRVKVGYRNLNSFTLRLPVGDLNQFTPGQGDRGQPDEFFAGLNKGVFNLDLVSESDQSVWRLNGFSSGLASTLPICEGECVDTPTGTITGQLNAVAIKLADAASDAADLLAAVPATRSEVRQATKRKAKRQVRTTDSRDRRDAERSRQAALEYERRSKELILEIPAVIKNCPEAPAFCTTVDRGPTIDALKVLYAESRNTVKRVVARAYFRATGHTYTTDPIVTRALRLEAQGNAELDKLPRFATECK